MTTTGFGTLFDGQPVMVILRGHTPERTVELSELAWDTGVDLVEVPIGEPGQQAGLAAAVTAGRARGRTVGAGTVVSPAHVTAAAEAGAAYTVAPGLNHAVVAACREAGLPHLPGVATASEIQSALDHGCDWVKVFPAATLGPGWFTAMRGPFPRVGMVATGGIGVDEVPRFLAAGANVIGLGSALSDDDSVRRLRDFLSRT